MKDSSSGDTIETAEAILSKLRNSTCVETPQRKWVSDSINGIRSHFNKSLRYHLHMAIIILIHKFRPGTWDWQVSRWRRIVVASESASAFPETK
jgi:hypothetical protein